MAETNEVMAIIRRPKYGYDIDRSCVGLSFTVYVEECVASDQFLPLEEATKLIAESRVDDIKHLDGKPCWVTREPGGSCFGIMRFLRYCRIG